MNPSSLFHDYPAENGASRPIVYVFPHAGGFASFFQPLGKLVAQRADCRVLQYGRRAERHREPQPATMSELVAQVSAAIRSEGREVVLYGHSLGASLAFETALVLGDVVQAVVVSARFGPTSDQTDYAGPLDESSIIARLRLFDPQTAAMLTANPDLRELTIPGIQADFRLLAGYRPTAAKLSVPLTVLVGRDDPAVPPDAAKAWSASTTAPFAFRDYPGGHFFIENHWPEIADLLTG
jgi:surfactin synthase thioesterase subunit